MNPDKRTLTDRDVELIVCALDQKKYHECRFSSIEEEDLRAAVDFYKNFNKVMSESGSTLRKTVIAIGVTGTISALVVGGFVLLKKYFSEFGFIP